MTNQYYKIDLSGPVIESERISLPSNIVGLNAETLANMEEGLPGRSEFVGVGYWPAKRENATIDEFSVLGDVTTSLDTEAKEVIESCAAVDILLANAINVKIDSVDVYVKQNKPTHVDIGDGVLFSTSYEDQSRLYMLAGQLEIGGPPLKFSTHAGQVLTMDATEAAAARDVVSALEMSWMTAAADHVEAIQALLTTAAVRDYSINAGWPA
mgnify:FL=1|tara:strand:- start:724 stop:1356 length:633 start_codon:yes stop_codon:yes gene_type:complete